MNRVKLLTVGMVIVGLTGFAYAGTPGDKGSTFLKLGQGARAIGMGEAFVAVADDINSLYWNPAGLTSIQDIGVTFMYSDWLEEIEYNYLAGVKPVAQLNGIMGVAITQLDSGDIDKTDGGGTKIGTFDGKDMAIAVSYAREIGGAWGSSIGGTLKYINRKIDGKKSTGFAIDVGGVGQPPAIDGLRVGWCVQNIGPKTSAFVNDKDGLPMIIKFGAAYNQLELLAKPLTLAMDVNLPADNDLNAHIGAEYNFLELLAFRLGFRTDTIDEHGTMSGLTAGFGFKYPEIGLSLDYAIVDYDELDQTHRVSLSIQR